MDLKNDYLKIITSQHRGKPKYLQTMETLLNPLDGLFEIATYFDDEFDLDEAVGKQQDILGAIIGQDRKLTFDYDGSSILDTEAYRVVQKSKIIKNLWNGQVGDLYNKWQILFGKPIKVKDNQNMTMEVLLDIDDSSEMQKLMKLAAYGLIVPKPMGVGIKFNFYYPDIILPLKIKHRAAGTQIVDANHNVWNLGIARTARWDGEFNLDGKIRLDALVHGEGYKERQTHNAEINISVESNHKNDYRIINIFDGSFCMDGSHIINGARLLEQRVNHCCIIENMKGVEVQ